MPASRLNWDVFLSFRGEDTRHTFTASLYDALKEEQVRVFLDNDGMNRGDEIAPSLVKAIEDSAASVIIISANYANSHWCLEELSKLSELRSSLGRPMLPVFYKVDPSHVRKQGGDFKMDFENHARRFTQEKIQKWRDAMKLVGGLSGFICSDDIDEQGVKRLIRQVVKRILQELSNTPENVAAFTVGLQSPLGDLMRLLDVKSSSVDFLGIYGMGGIGKTTLAKALYNKIIKYYENRAFISNVRERSEQPNGLISLQTDVISKLFNQTLQLEDVNVGKDEIRKKCCERKILLILDDVDNINQLSSLAGGRVWFGNGSRIIITTRDRRALTEFNVSRCYEVRCLDESDAMKLFSWHALRQEKPKDSLVSLSKKMVTVAGCLPLALEVIGSFLYDKRTEKEWEASFEKFKVIQPNDILGVLRISFDSLDKEEKCIFLDIACLFHNTRMKREDLIDVWDGCGFNAEIAINVLKQKSLVKYRDNTLWIHDQLRDMGRQIVIEESLDSAMRSRLWDQDEIMAFLKNKKRTRHLQGIVLEFEKSNLRGPKASRSYPFVWHNFGRDSFGYMKEGLWKWFSDKEEETTEARLHTKSFTLMSNLRLLQINHANLEGKFKYLPTDLKWLQWKGCPLKTLPSELPPGLAVLHLPESKIEQIWSSPSKKVAGNLKVLNLHGCFNLEVIPDLSGFKKLEKLVLHHCRSLVKIHESMVSLSKLIQLDLEDCSNLTKFPQDVSGLKHLEKLNMSGCKKLEHLPDNLGNMRCLKELLLSQTAITRLPESVFQLQNLEILSLKGCGSLKQLPVTVGELSSLKELILDQTAVEQLPHSVGSLRNLKKLSLNWCEFLTVIPDTIGHLECLVDLSIVGSGIRELPDRIGLLSSLEIFSAPRCRDLNILPPSIGKLSFLLELDLSWTPIENLPAEIGALTFVRKLELISCESLCTLPNSIGNMDALHSLNLSGSAICALPESLSMLENLNSLWLRNCKNLRNLPGSIGNLKSLMFLYMQETPVIELPESFGMLSNLIVLKMLKKPLFRNSNRSVPAEKSIMGMLEESVLVNLPTSFSNLSRLEKLDVRSCRIFGKVSDDFESLSSLEILNMGNNYISSLPSSLEGLCNLRELLLYDCQELCSLPPLPLSLQKMNLANCFSLESISNLSNLKILEDLNLTNCEKLVDIPGLEFLKSLKRLYLGGCNNCSRAIRSRLSKGCLKKLRNISVPGSEIPHWFSEDAVTISTETNRNREIKGVILAVVVALNHEKTDNDYQTPSVVDIQAQVFEFDRLVHTHTLNLDGVPRTDKDQVHFCRYPSYIPMVSMLKVGYKLRVVRRNPPFNTEVELKKSGIYLLYENEDDFDGNEELLEERHKTISQKLADFFSSS